MLKHKSYQFILPALSIILVSFTQPLLAGLTVSKGLSLLNAYGSGTSTQAPVSMFDPRTWDASAMPNLSAPPQMQSNDEIITTSEQPTYELKKGVFVTNDNPPGPDLTNFKVYRTPPIGSQVILNLLGRN